MARKKISQADARCYRNRVQELSKQINAVKYKANMAEHYGVLIDTINVTNTEKWIVRTAKLCKKILVIVPVDNEDKIKVFAVDS